ncbi:MAG: hypothetical protein H7A52_16975 [Akkermansiaceae bacterium]|nr:hypothetical protein [Akkermansiaceae bacterium]
MKVLAIAIAIIAVGFFCVVGVTMRQKIEAAIHVNGKTRFFEIGSGRVTASSGLGSLPGTGIKHRIVETDPGSPFTDFPTTQTPISISEFLTCAFAKPYFAGVSYFSVPYWWIAVLLSTPFVIMILRSKIRMRRSKTEANPQDSR